MLGIIVFVFNNDEGFFLSEIIFQMFALLKLFASSIPSF